MKEQSLVKTKDNNIFKKIFMFIKNIFKKEKSENFVPEYNKPIQEVKNFKNEIIIKRDIEKERLLKLQEDFRRGNITEEEITKSDVIKLHKLYDEQIEYEVKRIEMYKQKINKIRKKLTS